MGKKRSGVRGSPTQAPIVAEEVCLDPFSACKQSQIVCWPHTYTLQRPRQRWPPLPRHRSPALSACETDSAAREDFVAG